MATRAVTERRAVFAASFLALALGGEAQGQTVPEASSQAVNPVASVSLSTLTATRERPLFSPTRRPPVKPEVSSPAPPPPVVVAAAEPPTAPPFTLLGTVIGSTDRIAILMIAGVREATHLRKG